jgi:hypothetical protein
MDVRPEPSASGSAPPPRGALTGLRVIELADEQAEYCA